MKIRVSQAITDRGLLRHRRYFSAGEILVNARTCDSRRCLLAVGRQSLASMDTEKPLRRERLFCKMEQTTASACTVACYARPTLLLPPLMSAWSEPFLQSLSASA